MSIPDPPLIHIHTSPFPAINNGGGDTSPAPGKGSSTASPLPTTTTTTPIRPRTMNRASFLAETLTNAARRKSLAASEGKGGGAKSLRYSLQGGITSQSLSLFQQHQREATHDLPHHRSAHHHHTNQDGEGEATGSDYKGGGASDEEGEEGLTSASTIPFEGKLCGFIFNFDNMVPGMLYRSRNDPGIVAGPHREEDEEEDEEEEGEGEEGKEAEGRKEGRKDSLEEEGGGENGGEEDLLALSSPPSLREEEAYDKAEAAPEDLDLRQRMALTLRNWCMDEENLALVAQEGALQALAALATREDRLTRRYVASAFFYLSRSPLIRIDVINVGASSILSQVALSTRSPRVALTCASSLCYLTLEAGVEQRLAEEGAVGALCAMLTTFPHKDIWAVSLQALFNMTCVKESYNGIDRVLKGLMASFSSPFQDLDPSPLISLALCNLSVIYRLRLRILEEGALDLMVNALLLPLHHHLLHQHITATEAHHMRYESAVTLHNISCARTCRSEMVNRGALLPLLYLSLPLRPSSSSSPSAAEQSKINKDEAYEGEGFEGEEEEQGPSTSIRIFQDKNEHKASSSSSSEKGKQQEEEEEQRQKEHEDVLECVAATIQKLSLGLSTRRKIINDGAIKVILNILSFHYHPPSPPLSSSSSPTAPSSSIEPSPSAPIEDIATIALAATARKRRRNSSTTSSTSPTSIATTTSSPVLRRPISPATALACAEALHAFSSFDDCAPLLIKHQAVQALMLLVAANSNPPPPSSTSKQEEKKRKRTLQACAAAFCNLFSLEANHVVILDQHPTSLACLLSMGMKEQAVGSLDDDTLLIDHLSCLYNNLACGPRKNHAVMAGLVSRLVQFSDHSTSVQIKSRCSMAFSNLVATANQQEESTHLAT